MKRKHKFESPTVLQAVDLSLEGGLLAGSIVDQLEITSVGQEVHDLNADDQQFEWNENWNWED